MTLKALRVHARLSPRAGARLAGSLGLVLVLALALPPALRAQEVTWQDAWMPVGAGPQFVRDTWTAESGLPLNSVELITRGQDGYLWLGTQLGLTRFDGVRFTAYTNTTGLVGNDPFVRALLARRDGSVWIGSGVGLSRFEHADALFRFSVSDTGIDVPRSKQSMLFQKFSQADASTSRRYGGTGLGLAISKQVVDRMGGTIGVTSPLTTAGVERPGCEGHGPGSEFWFTVRLGKQPMVSRRPAAWADLRGQRVLVVDDNTTNREVLVAQLTAWDMVAEERADGASALVALRQAREAGQPFAAAVVDRHMPGMDGVALARAVLSEPQIADTRLILMAPFGERGDAAEMEQAGFSGYLTKPARHADLGGCLAAVLGRTATEAMSQPIVTRHTVREARRRFEHRKVRILLAEDNQTNQEVALGLLQKLGLRADSVSNGRAVLQALAAVPYDLVLMDIQMPEMDGLETTRAIRHGGAPVLNPQVPIVAMTANAMARDRQECLDAGMNDYVSKPVALHALAVALDAWLPKPDSAHLEESSVAAAALGENARAGFLVAGAARAVGSDVPSAFDSQALLSQLVDDEQLAGVVVQAFLQDIPPLVAGLREAVVAGDAAAAARQAHTIKGTAASVGAGRLRAIALALEQLAKGQDLAGVGSRLAELEREFEAAGEAMRQWRGRTLS